jgi:hypothetical protein
MHRLLTALAFLALAAITALTAPYAQEIRIGPIEIAEPWTRATAPGAPTGAGFVRLTNAGSVDDRLIAAEAEGVGRVELHTMTMDDGVMQMRRLDDGIALPAGEAVELAPGGLHLMFMGLEAPFVEGETVEATLTFESAGTATIELPVGSVGARSYDDVAGD